MEAMYIAFGKADAIVIADVPNAAAAAAASLAIGASGGASIDNRPDHADEMDQAAKTAPRYKPPGH